MIRFSYVYFTSQSLDFPEKFSKSSKKKLKSSEKLECQCCEGRCELCVIKINSIKCLIMAKSGNNESRIEKLVRVGFYELEKTIGKARIVWFSKRYLINSTYEKKFQFSLSMKQTQTQHHLSTQKKISSDG